MKPWHDALKEAVRIAPNLPVALHKIFGRDITTSEATFKASLYTLFADASPDGVEWFKAILSFTLDEDADIRKRAWVRVQVFNFLLQYLPVPTGAIRFTEPMMQLIMGALISERGYTFHQTFVSNPALPKWMDWQSEAFTMKRRRLLSTYHPDFIQTLLDNSAPIVHQESEIVDIMSAVGWEGHAQTLVLLINEIKKRFPDYDINKITESELLYKAVDRQNKSLVKQALSLFQWPQEKLNSSLGGLSKRIRTYKDGEWHKEIIEMLMASGASPVSLTRPMLRGWLDVEGRSYLRRIKEIGDDKSRPFAVEALLFFYAKDNKGNLNNYLYNCPQWQTPLVIKAMGSVM